MNISLNWLKDFVDIPDSITPQQLAEDLSVHSFEVEGVVDQAAAFENMIVGEIKKISDHPNADKLKLCSVSAGGLKKHQIVCGGKNIYEGMKCAVALPGSKVKWHGEGDLVELEETKIRGEKSFGMICAAVEIGLTDDLPSDEPYVMDLKIDAKAGTPLADALGLTDVVLDVDNKSITNRPDLWGHVGQAREIAALYKLESKVPSLIPIDASKDGGVKVRIENNELCRRFIAARVDNVTVGPSPEWMQQRLLVAGMRPINNIVDISNYVMLELGQPNHVFDAGKLGNEIVVRMAQKGEELQTLDGETRKLDPSMLMVTKGSEALAIAGVMGGGNSEVDEDTTSLVVEIANFEPVSVRETSQKLALRSEASARFEKGLDPALVEQTLKRILYLIQELIPDAHLPDTFTDVGTWQSEEVTIDTNIEFIQKRIGAPVSQEDIVGILERLGFRVSVLDSSLSVTVPSWRSTGDISIQEDIVEEVARHYGYNSIPAQLPIMESKGDEQTNAHVDLERTVKQYFTLGAGFQEVENYVFDNPNISKLLGFTEEQGQVEIANPLAEGQEYLRRTLLTHILKNIKANLRYQDAFELFEIGRIVKSVPGNEYAVTRGDGLHLPDQPHRLCAVIADKHASASDVYFRIKGVAEGLFESLRIGVKYERDDKHVWLESESEVKISVAEGVLGKYGLIPQAIREKLKIEGPVAALYIDYQLLASLTRDQVQYKKIAEYPAVTRDIAITVGSDVSYEELENTIRSQSDLLELVELFDVYHGKQVGAGKRSLAWHLNFRHPERTLTSQEADEEMNKITHSLETKHSAKLRS